MNAPIKADELSSAWSRNIWKPVYVFTGQEDFLIEESVSRLCAAKLAADNANLNHDRFDGEKSSAEDILQACQTVPFLSPTRVVEVRNTHRLSAEQQKLLAASVPNLSSSTFLILIWGKEWRRDDVERPLVEAVLTTGEVVIFWPLFPSQAQRWVEQRAKHYKKSIEPQAAIWLADMTDASLRRLDQELAKVASYSGGRPEITLEDVQASLGYYRASSPFEWLDALRRKQLPRAIQIMNRLLEEGEEPLRLLMMLSGTLRDWLSAKSGQESLPALARRFHLRRGEENAFLQELEKLSEEELVNGISACLEADQSIKTGKETPEMALSLLVLRLGRFDLLNAR